MCPETFQFKQAESYLQPPMPDQCMPMEQNVAAGSALDAAMFTDKFDAGLFRISILEIGNGIENLANFTDLEALLSRNVLQVGCFSSQCSVANDERFIRRQIQLPSNAVSGDYFIYLSLYLESDVYYSCSKIRILNKSDALCARNPDQRPVDAIGAGSDCQMFAGLESVMNQWQFSKYYVKAGSGQSPSANRCQLSKKRLGGRYYGPCAGSSKLQSPYEEVSGASSDIMNRENYPLYLPQNFNHPLDLETKIYVADITQPGSSFTAYEYRVELPSYPSTYSSINLTMTFTDWQFVNQMLVPGVKTGKTASSVYLAIDNFESPWVISTSASVSFTVIINDPSQMSNNAHIPEFAIIYLKENVSTSPSPIIAVRDTLSAETKRITRRLGYSFDIDNLSPGRYQLIFTVPCGTILPNNVTNIIQTGQTVDLRAEVSKARFQANVEGFALCNQISNNRPSEFHLIREKDGNMINLNTVYY